MRVYLYVLNFIFLTIAVMLSGITQVYAIPTYDLAVTGLRLEPAQGDTTTRFTYVVTIKNVGSVPAPMKDLVIGRNNDVRSTSGSTPGGGQPITLNPGETYECRYDRMHGPAGFFTGTLPEGRHVITATINQFQFSEDLNTANNVQYFQVEVRSSTGVIPGWPDLYIKKQSVTTSLGQTTDALKAEATTGNSVQVDLRPLENIGSQPALLPAGLLLGEATEKGQTMPLGVYVVKNTFMINPGDGGVLVGITIPAEKLTRVGLHEILLTADPRNMVREGNEYNNLLGFFIDMKGPDLAVTSVTTSPQNPNTQQNISLLVTVRNMSTGKAVYYPQDPSLLSYSPSTRTSKMAAPPNFSLAAGQEYRTTLTIPAATFIAGNYTIAVAVDQAGDPLPANNVFNLPITVRNISLQDISVDTSTTSPSKTQVVTPQPLQRPEKRLPQTAPPVISTPGGIK